MKFKILEVLRDKNFEMMFYISSIIWLIYLTSFIHELGHVITVIAMGGDVYVFEILWYGAGRLCWGPPANIGLEASIRMDALVGISGGIAAALLFVILSYKTKWFCIPAILSIVDGFLEALYLAEYRNIINPVITLSAMFITSKIVYDLGKERGK